MKYLINSRVALILILTAYSCNPSGRRITALLDQVETIVEQFPDSASLLLDSIGNPYELNKEQYNRYVLFSVYAKDKALKDITADTSIFRVRDYFEKKKEVKHLILAELYSGRVCQEQNCTETAVIHYQNAIDEAGKINDFFLMGKAAFLIGDLYYNQPDYSLALSYYQLAKQNFSKKRNTYKEESVCMQNIGICMFIKQEIDSAVIAFNEAFALAEEHRDTTLLVDLKLCLGIYHYLVEDTPAAKKLMLEALDQNRGKQHAKLYLNLAEVYTSENKLDSAEYYYQQAIACPEEDKAFQSSLYLYLSDLEKERGNFEISLEYHRTYLQYLSSVFQETYDKNLLEVHEKYKHELLQSENQLLRSNIYLAATISVVVILILLCYFLFKRYRYKVSLLRAYREKEEINLKLSLLSTEMSRLKEELENNREEAEQAKEKSEHLRMALYEYFCTVKEMAKGDSLPSKLIDWNIVYPKMNILYDNFIARLNTDSRIKDIAIQMCCMYKIGFYDKEIGEYYGKKESAVKSRRDKVKKRLIESGINPSFLNRNRF